MISIECDCGKKLKVKDEHAGKRVRCPECSEPIKIPVSQSEDSFLDDLEDDLDDEDGAATPPPRSRSAKSSKKPVKKPAKKSQRSGGGMSAKQIFGGIILALGVVFLAGMAFFVFTGNFEPKRLRAFILPVAMIGMGWAWMKGETFGS